MMCDEVPIGDTGRTFGGPDAGRSVDGEELAEAAQGVLGERRPGQD